ncbi:unnamed protein product, partial [Brassica rapa]
SVFHRLGSNEKEQGSGGSKEKRNARGVEGDLRLRLSGDSTVERAKGQSSKSSRSPPSVFERLKCNVLSSSRERENAGGSQAQKRRRQSHSDERRLKKPRTGSHEKKEASPSVFQRLSGIHHDTAAEGNGPMIHSAY